MAKLYKLTDANGQTRGSTQWGPNVTHRALGSAAQDLCSDGWIHAYEHPLLAVLLNPIHADFIDPRLWEAEGEIDKQEGQLKCGCRMLTTIREIPLPTITSIQKVAFAIYCGLAVVSKNEIWIAWANDWLSGKGRSREMAARAAEWAAIGAAAEAAEGAAEAAGFSLNLIDLANRAMEVH